MELLRKCWRRATIVTMAWLVVTCVVQAAETPLAPSPAAATKVPAEAQVLPSVAAATKDSIKDSTKVPGETPVLPTSAPPPVLTLAPYGGVFASNPVVTITGSTGEVRYTLDGSLPATNSAIYATPLVLSNSCLLRARAFAAGHQTGSLAAATFTLL